MKNYIQELYWRTDALFRCVYTIIAPISATKYMYNRTVGHSLNLKNPKTLTEKLQWLKIYRYRHNQIITKCIDKYAVRDYVSEKGCQELLVGIIGVWENACDINWDTLPEKFVLKCTHGCGYNIVCENKNLLDVNKTVKKLNGWMRKKYGYETAELIYEDIVPRIVCEKFIESEGNEPLKDYKIFCSYGEPKLIYVITGGHGSQECLDYYTLDWERIPVNNGTLPNSDHVVKKPDNLETMLKYASILSKDFPIVRVDFYNENGRIIFGELTFLATGGYSIYNPKKYDEIFGELFPILDINWFNEKVGVILAK